MDAKREIRIRGTATEKHRVAMVQIVTSYEREYLNDGRGGGFRNGVVWTWGNGDKAIVYHTKTTIVGLYQEAA